MSAEIIRLPGLIDVHVHLRDPGQTQKEDFLTGTSAALAGGFTTVLDMPNNNEPITTIERLKSKIAIAEAKTVCDIGFYYGSLGDNIETFPEAAKYSFGLKLYLNNTTGGYMLDIEYLKKIYEAWPHNRMIMLHVEEDVIDIALESIKDIKRPVHICHMPSREILQKIINAKKQGLPVTCGVTPHHLFMTSEDVERIGVYANMKPSLKSQADQDFLWDHLDDIDIFESDHAPHTHQEKLDGAFGVPNLETTLPMLLWAREHKKITLEQIIDKCYTRPAELFNIPTSDTTFIEVEMTPYVIRNEDLFTKCGWSPFDGREVPGKVKKVVIRGKTVFENGKVTTAPGSGRVVTATS